MKDSVEKIKRSLFISTWSVIICLAVIVIAVLNLRYAIVNGKETGSAYTMFFAMCAIFFSNLTLLIINIKKYKESSK